jgi:hypothetical protein
MSYFVFGQIRFSEDLAEGALASSAWRIVKHGYDVGLYITLGHNIIQKIVRAMVRETCGDGGVATPFLLAETPLEDTSHSLVEPFDLALEDLRRNLNLIERLVAVVCQDVCVERVTLIFSEGHSVEFERASLRTNEIASVLASKINEAREVPSLIVEVVPS